MLLGQVVAAFFSFRTINSRITETEFRQAELSNSVSNVVRLTAFVELQLSNQIERTYSKLPATPSQLAPPSVQQVEDLGVWQVGARFGCSIEGTEYQNGDYTPFGVIVSIADNKVYCKQDDRIVILRPKRRPAPSDASADGGTDRRKRTEQGGPAF